MYRLASDPTAFISAASHTLTTTSGYTTDGSPYSVWYQYPSSSSGNIIISTNSDIDLFVLKDNAQTWTSIDKGQHTGQSRHLMLVGNNGTTKLHTATAEFYGCSESCYNYVANGVSDLSGI